MMVIENRKILFYRRNKTYFLASYIFMLLYKIFTVTIARTMLDSRSCGCAKVTLFSNDWLCILDRNQKRELIQYKEQYTVLYTHVL